MNPLLNSEAYLGCFQGTMTFEFHIYYKSMAQSSFLTHLFPITVPSLLKAALKNFQRISSLFTLSDFTTILFFMQCQFSLFRKFFRFHTFLSIVLTIDFCYSHLVFLLSSRGVPGPRSWGPASTFTPCPYEFASKTRKSIPFPIIYIFAIWFSSSVF